MATVTIISLSSWQAASAQLRMDKEMKPQMHDHESIQAIAQSQTEPRARAHAKAKITVQNSQAKPYDQTASPALVEIYLSETFTGDYTRRVTLCNLPTPADLVPARDLLVSQGRA